MNEKIALFLPNLWGGGAERAMVNLAAGFAEQGHVVDLVVCSADRDYLYELDHRVRLVELGTRRVATSLPKLIGYLRREKPSAMLSTQRHANVIALIAGSILRVRTRIIVRDNQSLVGVVVRQKLRWMRFVGLLARYWYSKADGIVAVSADLKRQIIDEMSVPPDKIAVIYNPIRLDTIERLAKEPTDHDWLENPTAPVLLSIGRLDHGKDFASLIRAFHLIRGGMQAKLLILGEGPLRRKLIRLVESLELNDDIDLPGFVTNPFSYLARADVFVLSSLWEGLPNVMLEALAVGTPIVATDCETGPREILRNGRDGILVPVGDPAALAEGIRKSLLITTREPVASESLQRFNFRVVIDQYLQLLCPKN